MTNSRSGCGAELTPYTPRHHTDVIDTPRGSIDRASSLDPRTGSIEPTHRTSPSASPSPIVGPTESALVKRTEPQTESILTELVTFLPYLRQHGNDGAVRAEYGLRVRAAGRVARARQRPSGESARGGVSLGAWGCVLLGTARRELSGEVDDESTALRRLPSVVLISSDGVGGKAIRRRGRRAMEI